MLTFHRRGAALPMEALPARSEQVHREMSGVSQRVPRAAGEALQRTFAIGCDQQLL
jgi:hypothetical protein